MQPTRLPISPSTEFRYSSTIRVMGPCIIKESFQTIANTAMLVSIVIYLYNFLITLFQSTTTNVFYTLFMGLIVTFGIVMCVLVIYGGKAKKPWAFLPYLFMTVKIHSTIPYPTLGDWNHVYPVAVAGIVHSWIVSTRTSSL